MTDSSSDFDGTHESDAGARRPPSSTRVVGCGGDVVVQCLRACGADIVFNVSSTGQSPFYDALSGRSDLQMVLAPQEGLAVSMAHGYELASTRPGMLMLPGVGIPNAASNLYNAWKDRSSLVLLSDATDTRYTGRDGFQQVNDGTSIIAGFTKAQHVVQRPERIAELVNRAINQSITPIGGPVHVMLPVDVLAAADLDVMIPPWTSSKVGLGITPSNELIERAARMLIEANSPMINAGPEVSRAGAVADLVELAELLAIPVAQGLSVFCDFPFRHPLFAGHTSMGYPLIALETDTFLNLCAPMPDPSINTVSLPDTARVIDARLEYEKIADTHPTDLAIAANARDTIRALIDAISGMTTRQWRERLRADRMAAAASNRRQRLADQGWSASPLYAERLCHELDTLLDDDACVVVETGNRIAQDWMNFGPDAKTLIGPTTGFALGWGVGAASGVRIGRPHGQVVVLVGDGALLFGQIEALWTASRYDIPVTIVVFNNRSYDAERARIHFASRIPRTDNTAWRDMSCYLGDPNVRYAEIAGAFDIDAAAIAGPEDIEPVLQRAFAGNREGRPFLIDAAIAQRGPGAELNWYPDIDIPGIGHTKRNRSPDH